VELRVEDERPVVTVAGGATLDPAQLPIGDELLAALREWAAVAAAVQRAEHLQAPRGVVTDRGRYLAESLSAATGDRVVYVDPVTGATSVLGAGPDHAELREPTPWATGLTVSVVTTLVVLLGMAVLYAALSQASEWLALVANLVLTAGLVPTILLIRRQPVWRWVAHGITAGLALGWIGWLITLA
jgi:hypothetical protein